MGVGCKHEQGNRNLIVLLGCAGIVAERARDRRGMRGPAGGYGMGAVSVMDKHYVSQAAGDAAASGYGGPRYADYLEETALRHRDWYAARGNALMAERMLTRDLGAALAGNDGA